MVKLRNALPCTVLESRTWTRVFKTRLDPSTRVPVGTLFADIVICFVLIFVCLRTFLECELIIKKVSEVTLYFHLDPVNILRIFCFIYTHMHIHTDIHTHLCICIHKYIHQYILQYIHTHTYMCTKHCSLILFLLKVFYRKT